MPPLEFSRRTLLAGGAALGSRAAAPLRVSLAEPAKAEVRVEKHEAVRVETGTLRATLEKGYLTSLESKLTGEKFIEPFDRSRFDAVRLVYRGRETVDLGEQLFGNVSARQITPTCAEFRFHNWHGDGVLRVSADAASGDLILEPSGYSSRPGVRACRYTIAGIRRELRLVAPFYQGVALELNDPLIRGSHWFWPQGWEAGFVILHGAGSGFWVHTQDNRYRYKALRVSLDDNPYALGFDAEAYGPIEDNLAAGGLAWRVNVYRGGWQEPAGRYREWLWKAYDLAAEQRRRAPWIHQLGMAISWCPTDVAILESLARKVKPGRVLIHLPNWRTDPYDENYPTYTPSEAAKQFLARARQLGFHVLPHFNSLEVDPNHPVYAQVRDFQYRDVDSRRIQGWSWVNQRNIGVPESNLGRLGHRDKKVMTKIHPGLSMWRSLLCERIQENARALALEAVFLDVVLVTGNLHNALVEGMTSSEGINRLIHEVGELAGGLSVGGEGLNEVIAPGLSFAQVHLFRSGHSNIEGLERTGGCALNDFLFGKICRSFGYSGLGGRDAAEELRARIHEEHNALPTITIRSAEDIENPTPWVRRALERAGG
ncbi:MAG: DUF6259 domain-containing protein [Bryobacterales bacterium]|nr:DUF6259 domain-containing protein [Bryobacterales bacterium]